MTQSIERIPGIGGSTAKLLKAGGFKTVQSIAKATPEALSKIRGFGPIRALRVIEAATALAKEGDASPKPSKPKKTKEKSKKKDSPAKKAKGKKDKKADKKKAKDKKSGKKSGKKKKK